MTLRPPGGIAKLETRFLGLELQWEIWAKKSQPGVTEQTREEKGPKTEPEGILNILKHWITS